MKFSAGGILNFIKNNKKTLFSGLLTLIFIVLIFWNLDFRLLIATFKTFNCKVLFVVLPLYLINLLIRGIRWKMLLFNCKNFKIKDSFFAYATGAALNIYFPARFGDFWRSYHVGKKLQQSKAKILGSILLERITDGIAVLFFLLFATLSYRKSEMTVELTIFSAILFIGSLAVIYLVLKFLDIDFIVQKISKIRALFSVKKTVERTGNVLKRFIEGFESLNSPKHFFTALAISILVRFIEGLIIYSIIKGFGLSVGFSLTIFVITFAALSTIIPSVSIFIGAYQYSFILAFGLYDINKAIALDVAFVNQIVSIIILAAITISYLNINNIKLGSIQKSDRTV